MTALNGKEERGGVDWEKLFTILLNVLEEELQRLHDIDDDRMKNEIVRNIRALLTEIRQWGRTFGLHEEWKEELKARIELRRALAEQVYRKIRGDKEEVRIQIDFPSEFFDTLERMHEQVEESYIAALKGGENDENTT